MSIGKRCRGRSPRFADSSYVKISKNLFGCAAARNKGTCTNRLTIKVDRQALSRFGINVADVQNLVEIAVAGKNEGQVFEGDVNGAVAAFRGVIAECEADHDEILKPASLMGLGVALGVGRVEGRVGAAEGRSRAARGHFT